MLLKIANSDLSQASMPCCSVYKIAHFCEVAIADTLGCLSTRCICTAHFFALVSCLSLLFFQLELTFNIILVSDA